MNESSETKDNVTSSHKDKNRGSCSSTEPQTFNQAERYVCLFIYCLLMIKMSLHLFVILITLHSNILNRIMFQNSFLFSSWFWLDSLNVFVVLRFISGRELLLQCLAMFLWRVMHQWILQLNSSRKIKGNTHLFSETIVAPLMTFSS